MSTDGDAGVRALLLVALALASLASPQRGVAAEPVAPPGSPNLLAESNADFEQPGGGIQGWETAYGEARVVPGASGGHVLECSHSVKLYSERIIEVQPGTVYHMGVRGKFRNLKFRGSGYGVGFGLEQQNARRQLTSNWYYMQNYLKYAEGDSDWVAAEYTCNPSETAVHLRPFLLVWAAEGSQVWFDDVRVWEEKLPLTRMLNVTENGSFETRYQMGQVANGFSVLGAPDAGTRAVCVEDVSYQGAASLKVSAPVRLTSNAGYTGGQRAAAQVALKTVGLEGAGAYAEVQLLDRDRRIVARVPVAEVAGDSDWRVFRADLSAPGAHATYARWEFGLRDGASGTAYFDDLRIEVPSSLQPLPFRPRNTRRAAVTVDCRQPGPVFESSLNAFDTGGSQLLYSPTWGTAGRFVEGPGRWLSMRRQLGFRYIRLHHIYTPHAYTVDQTGENQWRVNFGSPVTDWATGRPFPPPYGVDSKGQVTYDFSAMKYLLDKGVLESGCKPIIGLAQVPTWLAKGGNPMNIPTDWKQWEDLNYRFTRFLVQTYGRKEVSSWIFENWNEPGTEPQFKGDPDHPERLKEDLFRLMDHAIAGVTRALPEAFISGDSGGIGGTEYLEHCARETNYATGKQGGRLDAISLHGYLSGSAMDISWRPAENAILAYQEAISRVARDYGRKVKLLNTEFAPIASEGQPDLKAIPHEQNNHIQAIAALHTGYVSHKHGVSLVAFFHQAPGAAALYNGVPRDQVPEFTGTNTCITYHGVITPVCRAYQMMSMLNGGRELAATADSEPIWTLATARGDQIRVLVYSYDPDPQADYTTHVRLSIVPDGPATRYHARRYELSGTKANSWYLAQQTHLTQADCERDISLVDKLNRESDLQAEDAGAPEVVAGKLSLRLQLPAYSAALIVLDPVLP